jgi:hypothetical protein
MMVSTDHVVIKDVYLMVVSLVIDQAEIALHANKDYGVKIVKVIAVPPACLTTQD